MINKTDIYYFSKIDGKKIKLNECIIHRTFMYKRINFFLMEKNGFYFICTNGKDKNIYSIWSKNKSTLSPSEFMSTFRKEYDKNNINSEIINNFINDPKRYTLLTLG